MTRRTSVVALVAITALTGLAGCKSKNLEAHATAKVTRENSRDVVVVDVDTEPKAEVRVNDSSYSNTQRATADDKGHATLKVVLPEPTPAPASTYKPYGSSGSIYGGSSGYGSTYGSSGSTYGSTYGSTSSSSLLGSEIHLDVHVETMTQKTLGKPKYRYGSTSVTAQRPAAVRYDATSRQVRCIVKACTGTLTVGAMIKLDFSDVEPNTLVDLGGSRARTITRTLSVSLDVLPLLDKVPLSDVFKEYPVTSVDLPLRLEMEGGTTLETKINIPANQLRPALLAAFAGVSTKALRFPEEAATGGQRTLFLSPRGEIFGSPDRAHDVDLVAVRTDRDRPGCDDGASDAVVKVYERRTGKMTTQKIFSAPLCNHDYEEKDIDAWLQTLIK